MAFARDPYTATNAQTDFTITFSYIAAGHVVVEQNGSTLTNAAGAGNYTIVSTTTVRLGTGATTDDIIVITRKTSQATALVDFTVPSTLVETDLDDSATQLLYMAQEALDKADFAKDGTDNWDALSKLIKNVKTPSVSTDAVNKAYADAIAAAAGNAPTPGNPGEDDFTLVASAGTFAWAKLPIAGGGTNSTTAAAALTALAAAGTTISNTFTKIQIYTKGGDLTSASPLVLDTDGNYFDVSGTTGFSQITCTAGSWFILQFDAALTMTDGANLDLGGVNIVTAAGDRGTFFAVAANTAQLQSYTREGVEPRKGGGWEFVSTTSITVIATIATTGMEIGYDYILTMEGFAPTDDDEELWLRFSDDLGVSYESDAADYAWCASVAGVAARNESDVKISISGNTALGNDTGNIQTVEVTLINPAGTSDKTMALWTGFIMETSATPLPQAVQGGAFFLQGTNAVTACIFQFEGGSTFQSQGDITVYRRKRAN